MAHGKMVMKFDDTKASRLGVLPRYAPNEAQIKWFTIPTCFIFHNGKEGSHIVLTMHLIMIQYAWVTAFSSTIDPMAWRCSSKILKDKMFTLKLSSIEVVSYTTN
jgi:carotenoid cleavage dioxygenase-like enzyme